jgi:hypothetical protein
MGYVGYTYSTVRHHASLPLDGEAHKVFQSESTVIPAACEVDEVQCCSIQTPWILFGPFYDTDLCLAHGHRRSRPAPTAAYDNTPTLPLFINFTSPIPRTFAFVP